MVNNKNYQKLRIFTLHPKSIFFKGDAVCGLLQCLIGTHFTEKENVYFTKAAHNSKFI